MGEVKEINIKNQTYSFFGNMTDIRNFHSNLLKIHKKSHKDINIYYINPFNSRRHAANADVIAVVI